MAEGEVIGHFESLSLNKFFDPSANVVASRPPEQRPTATPTARANFTEVYCGSKNIF